MTRARRVSADTIGQAVARLVAATATVASLHLAATYLGPKSYGNVVIVLAISQVLVGVADFGIPLVVARDISLHPDDSKAIMGTAFGLRLSMGVLSLTIATAFVLLAFASRAILLIGVLVVAPLFLTRAIDVAYGGFFAAKIRNTVPLGIVATSQVLSVPILWVLLRCHAGVVGYLSVVGGSALLASLGLAAAARHRLQGVFRLARWGQLLRVAAPLGAVTVVNMLYLRLDAILLALERSTAQVGYYGLAYRLVDFVVGLPGLLMIALFPPLVHADRAERLRLIQRALDVLLTVSIGGCLLLALLAHPVAVLLGGHGFSESAKPLAVLSLGAALTFPSAAFGHGLVAMGEQHRLLRVVAVVTTVNLLANLLLIPLGGATGAAAALAMSEVVALAMTARAFSSATGTRPSWAHIVRVMPPSIAMVAGWAVLARTPLHGDSGLAVILQTALLGSLFIAVAWLVGALRPIVRFAPGTRGQ